jgi:Protein of unknown function (DUF1579)
MILPRQRDSQEFGGRTKKCQPLSICGLLVRLTYTGEIDLSRLINEMQHAMETLKPTIEHNWLLQLIGDWTFESECNMEPEQPPIKSTGKQTTRSLGALWTLGEMEHAGTDGQTHRSILTLGYDESKQRFVGSFVTSCMTHLWPYDGQLDSARKVLTLDSEGPSFASDGTMAKYQDIVEIVDNDKYLLKSQLQNADGSWVPFMIATYNRVAAGS